MNKDWIALLTLSLITSFAWIGFEVYRAATQPAIPQIEEKYVRPLDPTLDQTALEIIRATQEEQ